MPAPTIPDPRLDEILREVRLLRGDVTAIRDALGPSAAPPARPVAPPGRPVATSDRGPTMPGASPAAPQQHGAAPVDATLWAVPGAAPPAAGAPRVAAAPATPGPVPGGAAPAPGPAAAPAPGPAAAPAAGLWAPRSRGGADPAPTGPTRPSAQPGGAASAPAEPRVARPSRLGAWLTPQKALAVAGSLVTLVGVVLLLALAARHAWYGRVPRVVSLAVLGAVLAWAARRVRPHGADVATALAATSAAAGNLLLYAVTIRYDWLHPAAGTALAVALALAWFRVADRWRDESLALLVLAEVGLLLPLLVDLGSITALLVWGLFAGALLLGLLPTLRARRWRRLLIGGVTLVTLVAGAVLVISVDLRAGSLLVLGAVALLAVFAAGTALAFAEDGAALLPLLVAASAAAALDRPEGAIVAATIALLAVAAAHRAAGVTRAVLQGAAVVFVALATWQLPLGRAHAVALLGEAVTLAAVALLRRSGAAWRSAAFLAVVGGLALTGPLPPVALAHAGLLSAHVGWEALAGSALLAAAGGIGLAATRRLDLARRDRRVHRLLAAVAGVGGATAALVVAGAMALPGTLGFDVGHVLATALWVGVGLAAVVRGGPTTARVGFAWLGFAAAKLFLFDLAAVDGILRAALFLLTGLVVLAASARLRERPRP